MQLSSVIVLVVALCAIATVPVCVAEGFQEIATFDCNGAPFLSFAFKRLN